MGRRRCRSRSGTCVRPWSVAYSDAGSGSCSAGRTAGGFRKPPPMSAGQYSKARGAPDMQRADARPTGPRTRRSRPTASRVEPSWNVTPSRSVQVQTVRSSFGRALGRQRRASASSAADLVAVQRLLDLLAGAQGLAVGLVAAVQAEGSAFCMHDEDVAVARPASPRRSRCRAARNGRPRRPPGTRCRSRRGRRRTAGTCSLDEVVRLRVERGRALRRPASGRRA